MPTDTLNGFQCETAAHAVTAVPIGGVQLTGTGACQPEGFTPVAMLTDVISSDRAAAMRISIGGATVRVLNGTSLALLIAVLRELRA